MIVIAALAVARVWLGLTVIGLFGMIIGVMGWTTHIQREIERAREIEGIIGLCRQRKSQIDMRYAAATFFAICSAEIVVVAVLVFLPS